VFIRLTATSIDEMDSADRASRAELTQGKSGDEARDVAAVLEAFAAERLLTLAASSVEISHEILLTAWPLLREVWLAETHADRIVRTRLRNVAAEWARDSEDPSYLYSGSLMEAAPPRANAWAGAIGPGGRGAFGFAAASCNVHPCTPFASALPGRSQYRRIPMGRTRPEEGRDLRPDCPSADR